MKKIVIVDDDLGMLEFASFILGKVYSVQTAQDGVEGLELIQKERPDLVLLDLLMPRMHGFEVCRKIRQNEALKGIKVLISSSKSYMHDISTAKEAGADDYLVKPYETAALLWKVEELIGEVKTPLALKFWGTRGSLPSPGPGTHRYGGNTPCTELRVGETVIIIDAGSGLRELGLSLMKEFKDKPLEAHLFVGHTHWDHIQGFPFFVPAYLPNNKINLYGVHGTTQGFSDIMAGQMSPTYFPVAMKEMASRLKINELSGVTNLAGVKVSYHYLNHPGITIGFRFESRNWSVSYISDHEPYQKLNNKGEFSDKEDAAIARFVEGSDLLISEAQYTGEEYKYKKSWGHSTFQDVLDLASKAKVKQLALFHHDPTHTDELMDKYVAESSDYLAKHAPGVKVFGAMEGMTLNY